MTTHLVITICTYRRKDALHALLETLKPLVIPSELHVSARIIDNDQTPSARQVFEEMRGQLAFDLDYVHEPRPGLSSVRNRALAEAQDQDLLAFVDDDETVDANWLAELWRVHRAQGAQFTQGPVIYQVEDEADRWWIEGGFFRQNLFPDGAAIREAWTNNVLIDLNFLRAHDIQFDMAVGMIGGEDTLFFQDIVRHGGQGAFAAQALVYEMQPKERLSWRWGLKRHYRYGMTRALCALLRQDRSKAIVQSLVRAGGMMGLGLLKLPLALVRGRRGLADSLAYMARSLGVVSGLLGRRYDAYGR